MFLDFCFVFILIFSSRVRASGLAVPRRAAEQHDRGLMQGHSSSSVMHREGGSLPNHSQTVAEQLPHYPPRCSGADTAPDRSNAAVSRHVDNPNVVPLHHHAFGPQASVQSSYVRQQPSRPQQQALHYQQQHHLLGLPAASSLAPGAVPSYHQGQEGISSGGMPSGNALGLWTWPQAPLHEQSLQAGQAVSHGAQHSKHARGDDSSDSSSSQLGAQQQPAQSSHDADLPRPPPVQSNAHAQLSSRLDCYGDADAVKAVLPTSNAKEQGSGGIPALSKQQAAEAVKGLIKPLYIAKQLSKEQFKSIAQACTHTLADGDKTAGRSTHTVVRDYMKALGLDRQSAVL